MYSFLKKKNNIMIFKKVITSFCNIRAEEVNCHRNLVFEEINIFPTINLYKRQQKLEFIYRLLHYRVNMLNTLKVL